MSDNGVRIPEWVLILMIVIVMLAVILILLFGVTPASAARVFHFCPGQEPWGLNDFTIWVQWESCVYLPVMIR